MSDNVQSREERRKQQLADKAKQNQKGKKNKKGMLKKIFLVCVALGVVGVITGVATFAFMVKDAPKIDESRLKDPIPSEIFDKDGNLVTVIGSENRDYVEYEEIPKLVEDAFLATEDVRFYKHNGVDLIRLGGAVIANITDGYGSEGASTITQQVVKNSFLSTEKTMSRKVQEAWLSYQLEQRYTKHEIFEMYVNKIWMSENSSGVKTAAKIYFNKELDQLELHEAALLAGMPQSPENYNPFNYPDKAEKRRNIVLLLMNQHGKITKEQMETAQNIPVESTLVKVEDRKSNEKPFNSFIDRVVDEVKGKYGENINIFTDGLKVYTTLDQDAQQHVEKLLDTNEFINYPDENFQAGITLLDTKTGEIRAIGGGRNQKVQFGFNFATDTRRQPGSTIKPILDYGPAIENLNWGTYHTLDDKPYTYSDGTPVKNWDSKHMGVMSIREALARSRNIPAIQALQQVGLPKARNFAVDLGIPLPDPIFESYAIGGLKDGVSPLQMAGAFSAFGNNGIYTEPYAVKEIELRDGTKIKTAPESNVVMKESTAFLITDMLKSVVNSGYGSGGLANVPGLHLAGKTGTTNYSGDDIRKWNIQRNGAPDIWFAGYTTNYTAAIWTGYKDRKNSIAPNDQKLAQLMFKNLMGHVSKNVKNTDFTIPRTVEKIAIEKGTFPAKLASEFTPKDLITYEYAVKGTDTPEVSDKYNKLEAPSNSSVKHDIAGNKMLLKWDYPQEVREGVSFEVSISINGEAEKVLTTTTETELQIANPSAATKYTFKIIAIRGEQRSDPATTSINIPKPDDGDDDDEGNHDPDGNNHGDDGQGDNGDNNGNPNPGSNPGGGTTNPGILPNNGTNMQYNKRSN